MAGEGASAGALVVPLKRVPEAASGWDSSLGQGRMWHVPAQEEVSLEKGWFAGYGEAAELVAAAATLVIPLSGRGSQSYPCVYSRRSIQCGISAAPRAWLEHVSFPNEGRSQQGEGASGRMVQRWAWGGSCGRGHWEQLSLQLLSPCAGCLRFVSQSFLGMGGCCGQGECGCRMFRAIAACGACGLLGKHHRHPRGVRRGPVLCIWPRIPAEGVVQMLGAKAEWPHPSESAQPAKSSAGGMLCLPAIAAVHAHAPGPEGCASSQVWAEGSPGCQISGELLGDSGQALGRAQGPRGGDHTGLVQ